MPNRWLNREEQLKQAILESIAQAFLEEKYPKPTDRFIEFLAQSVADINSDIKPKNWIADFNQALENKDKERLAELLNIVPFRALARAPSYEGQNLPEAMSSSLISKSIDGNKINLEAMAEYIEESNAHVAVAISSPTENASESHVLSHSAIEADRPQAIHSVGKVFTGVLIIKMLQEQTITESYLNEKIGDNEPHKFDPQEWEKFPAWLKEHLKDCTLSDLMQHKSGLGNYLTEKYMVAIKTEVKLAKSLLREQKPLIESSTDFLKYAEEGIYRFDDKNPNTGEPCHYSNLGFLLVGMAAQYAYNSKNKTALSYDAVLKQVILDPAEVECFASRKPDKAITAENDEVSPHIVASSAGGHWSTVADLAKFGNWLVKQSKDPKFMQLLKKHGSEFYDSRTNTINHNGRIPASSAEFTCDLNNGTVITVLSNMHAQAVDFLAVLRLHATNDAAMSLTQSSNEGLKQRLTSSTARHPPSVTREFNQESSHQNRKKLKEEQSANDNSNDNSQADNVTREPTSPKQ